MILVKAELPHTSWSEEVVERWMKMSRYPGRSEPTSRAELDQMVNLVWSHLDRIQVLKVKVRLSHTDWSFVRTCLSPVLDLAPLGGSSFVAPTLGSWSVVPVFPEFQSK